MPIFRLKTSDIEAVLIDAEWQAFLAKERGITAKVGDYFYEGVNGAMCTMEKVHFERLFSPVSS